MRQRMLLSQNIMHQSLRPRLYLAKDSKTFTNISVKITVSKLPFLANHLSFCYTTGKRWLNKHLLSSRSAFWVSLTPRVNLSLWLKGYKAAQTLLDIRKRSVWWHESEFTQASTFISYLWKCFWNGEFTDIQDFFFKDLFFLEGRLLVIT